MFELRGMGSPGMLTISRVWVSDKPGQENTRLSVEKPAEQNVELVVEAPGFAPQTRVILLTEPTNQVHFALAPGSVFRGHIVDENGNPIPGAIVRTDSDFLNQVDDRFELFIHATPDGRFEWDSAPPEPVHFWFEADGFEIIRSTPMLPDGTDHEIILKQRPRQENGSRKAN